MKSLRELYKIGRGPSSSHTMGPQKASQMFLAKHPEAAAFEVTLYGSLAATGKGHLTDVAVKDALSEKGAPVEIIWRPDIFLPYHPNGMKFVSRDADGNATDEWMVYSVGGGTISEGPGSLIGEGPDIYALHTIKDIMQWCRETGRSIWEYVDECEDSSIWDYLMEVWTAMKACVERGLDNEGVLPGQGFRLQAEPPDPWTRILLCPRRERGKRLRRHRGHRAYLRFLRGASGRAIPYREGPQFLRQAHTARAGDGWHLRQRGQAQRLHLGRRGGVPG